jgi:hypothetical protein
VNGQNYTQSGTYTQVLSAANGCDSTLNLNISITNIDTSLSQNGLTLTANEAAAQYQWYNCFNNQPIIGATGQSFTPTAAGFYAVLITQSGCSANSACAQINISGQVYTENNSNIKIYPNPNKGSFQIDLSDYDKEFNFIIYNLSGQEIPSILEINNSLINVELQAPAGVYFLKSASQNLVFKIIKIE